MGLQAMSVGFWVVVGLMVLAVVLLGSFLASLYRKAGPHEALIVYGFRGTRIVKGHGTVIFPMVESCHELSLELMSFDVAPVQDLYTKQGVAVTVEAVAQIKVKSDMQSIETAAEQFLTKTPDQRESLIRLVMEGHLRGIIGQLTVEQIVKEPEMVADRMRAHLRRRHEQDGPRGRVVHDQGSPRQERLHRQHGPARRRAHQARRRRGRGRSRSRYRDQARRSDARVGRSPRRRPTRSACWPRRCRRPSRPRRSATSTSRRRNYVETVKKQQAQADKAYEIQTNVMQQQVIAESVRVQQVERESQIKVQEAEIMRREKELIATVLKPAEIERQRIARARRGREEPAVDRSRRRRRRRPGCKGEAEADIIFKKGDAEARAMNVKAEAFQEYNQAAVIDKLLTQLPEIVARAGRRRSRRSTRSPIVSTGNGRPTGMHKLTGDITEDRGAGAGALRGALGHADVRAAVEGAQARRQGPLPPAMSDA